MSKTTLLISDVAVNGGPLPEFHPGDAKIVGDRNSKGVSDTFTALVTVEDRGLKWQVAITMPCKLMPDGTVAFHKEHHLHAVVPGKPTENRRGDDTQPVEVYRALSIAAGVFRKKWGLPDQLKDPESGLMVSWVDTWPVPGMTAAQQPYVID